MTTWTHKVVKQQRGSTGQWNVIYPAAMTTDSVYEAIAYAMAFQAAQETAGVVGTRITVQTRWGCGDPTKEPAAWIWNICRRLKIKLWM